MLKCHILRITSQFLHLNKNHHHHYCNLLHQAQQPQNNFLYSILFNTLRTTTSIHTTKTVHGLIIVSNHVGPVLGSQLVNAYCFLGCLDDAVNVFDRLPKRNSFAWNSIIKGLVDDKQFYAALQFYDDMVDEGVEADNFTYPLVLKACAGLSDVQKARKIHELVELDRVRRGGERNVYVECGLIDMFAKCGDLEEARRVFDGIGAKDLVLWSAMICGIVHNGEWLDAVGLFREMRLEGFQPDSVITASVIPACGRLGDLGLGMGFHCCTVKTGLASHLCVSNALIDMYCKCGDIDVAFHVFQFMEFRDVVSWSSLVAGCSQNANYTRSHEIFQEMVALGMRPSSVTLASVLSSLAEMRLLKQGKEIHCYALKLEFGSDRYVSTALIDFYWKFALTKEAGHVYEKMSGSDIAIWNSMISGFALIGDVCSCFEMLRRIGKSEQRPNSITVITVLPLCNKFSMLIQGKELHGYVFRVGLSSLISVNNSLIDMYCKCGYLILGKKIFEQMTARDVVTYNTLIAAFGMHGHGYQAISFFEHMKGDHIQPDKVTFVALISACSHCGLFEQGLSFYKSMIEDYQILPSMEHYSCIVDLYSRSGHLDAAWEFIQKMPAEPNIDVLGSLLASCRLHKRVDLAEVVGRRIFRKKHRDPGYHILLSNIYAASGRWEDAGKVRSDVKDCGLIKKPANSRI